MAGFKGQAACRNSSLLTLKLHRPSALLLTDDVVLQQKGAFSPTGMASELKQPLVLRRAGRRRESGRRGRPDSRRARTSSPREGAAGNCGSCLRTCLSPPVCLHPESGGIQRC